MGRTKHQKAQKRSVRTKHQSKNISTAQKPSTKRARSSTAPKNSTVPFEEDHRILLIGEGDFSFARSLVEHHNLAHVYATSYDTHSTSSSKYPQVAAHTRALEGQGCRVEYAVDATKLGRTGGGGKEIRAGGWDRIVFNFPHVGGLTKDVNRQVRANQELLVGFLRSALPLLSSQGLIVVTLFDGEPYELWNIRDLARHTGFKVDRSFRFQAAVYLGYQHARTLGNIEGGGGWKGGDRSARTYLLSEKMTQSPTVPKKRAREASTSDSE